jgi:hypothetical protein
MRLSNETLYANTNVIPIHSFRIILIKLTLPDRSCQNFDLLDAVYVLGFYTSIVLFRRLYRNNIYWDIRNLYFT